MHPRFSPPPVGYRQQTPMFVVLQVFRARIGNPSYIPGTRYHQAPEGGLSVDHLSNAIKTACCLLPVPIRETTCQGCDNFT